MGHLTSNPGSCESKLRAELKVTPIIPFKGRLCKKAAEQESFGTEYIFHCNKKEKYGKVYAYETAARIFLQAVTSILTDFGG